MKADDELSRDEQVMAVLDEMGTVSRRMLAIECAKRGIYDDVRDKALIEFIVRDVRRITRKRDSAGCPVCATTDDKAADGNPVVKRMAYMSQGEFHFVLDSRWAQVAEDMVINSRLEERYAVLFGEVYAR